MSAQSPIAARLWPVLILMLAMAQIAVAALIFSQGFAAATADSAPAITVPNLATPAPYAFAIWGPIYLGALISAPLQLRPRYRDDPALQRARPAVALAYCACAVWIVAARHAFVLTAPIIVVMALALWTAFIRTIAEQPRDPVRNWAIIVPLGLFTGWIGAAWVVNCGDLIFRYPPQQVGNGVAGSLLILGIAAAIAIYMAQRTRGHLAPVAAQLWALVAIIVTNSGVNGSGMVALAAGVAIIALSGATWRAREAAA